MQNDIAMLRRVIYWYFWMCGLVHNQDCEEFSNVIEQSLSENEKYFVVGEDRHYCKI